jgi:hypothetical protein
MRRLVPPLVLIALACLPVSGAMADTFPVTNTNDSDAGSLRAAILAANAHQGGDEIAIGVGGAIRLNTMLPVVEGIITITGPGPGSLAIEPAAATGFRILSFGDGTAAVMSGLTIRGGTSRQGGGIRSGENSSLFLTRVVVAENEARDEGGSEAVAEGGGILSEGELVLRESTIRDNTATAVAGTTSSSALGGGVLAAGPITVERSTISGNVAEAHGEGGGHSRAWGGGMRTVASSSATVEVSTVSDNSVAADNSLTNEARGGGLEGAEMNLVSSTLVGNSLHSIGGAIGANLAFSGTATVSDTIVAEPGGDAESCASQLGSGGFNLDEDGSCEFGQATDLAGVASGVDPVLRDNGGPTLTHALLEGSPAIDRGGVFITAFDQRGLPRPIDFASVSNTEGGNGSDIGAFELQAPPVASGGPVLVSEQPADRQPPNTRIVKGPARSTYETRAKFRFASTEAQSSFQCKVDKKKWAGCRNPAKRAVKPGKHLFKVRAIDRFGNVDPTPARFGWRVKPIRG